MSAAGGTTPSAEVTKIATWLACAISSTSASGIIGVSRYGQPSALSSQRQDGRP